MVGGAGVVGSVGIRGIGAGAGEPLHVVGDIVGDPGVDGTDLFFVGFVGRSE